MVPLITREITFGQHVCELVLGVNLCDLDFGSKLILSNNQSDATLWVLDTCLIAGLLPIMIIFDHRFILLKKCTTELQIEKKLAFLTT